MSVKFIDTKIKDLIIIETHSFHDKRGYFRETFNADKYTFLSNGDRFLQDNLSYSTKNVLRGLHYNLAHPQAKLIYVVKGEIFDVVVDIRRKSPTFSKWFGINLSDINGTQLSIPKGFAHGFCVLSDEAYVCYKCTDVYFPEDQFGILWNDPKIDIKWPVLSPNLSEKDMENPTLDNVSANDLPVY